MFALVHKSRETPALDDWATCVSCPVGALMRHFLSACLSVEEMHCNQTDRIEKVMRMNEPLFLGLLKGGTKTWNNMLQILILISIGSFEFALS